MTGRMDDAVAAMRANFVAQFDDEDGAIGYRPFGRGASIAVTRRERDDFLAGYDLYLTRYRRMIWVAAGGATVAIVILIAIAVVNDVEIPESAFLIGGIVISVLAGGLAVLSNKRAMAAPLRQLAGRPADGAVVTPGEARRQGLRRMPWSNLGLGAGLIGLTVFKHDLYRTPWEGAHRYWSIGVAGFVALLGIQAFRKWRAEVQP